jgi:hypothetical protein
LSLLASQAGAVDETLNEAFHALKEKEHLQRRLARLAEQGGNANGAAYHQRQADHVEQSAAVVWRLLLNLRDAGNGPTEPG